MPVVGSTTDAPPTHPWVAAGGGDGGAGASGAVGGVLGVEGNPPKGLEGSMGGATVSIGAT